MASKKPKSKPRKKKDTWKPTPLAPVPRTEEELRAFAQWQAHKRELAAQRGEAQDAREAAFKTTLQEYISAAQLPASVSRDEVRLGDGFPFRWLAAEQRRGDAGIVFDRLVATKFRRELLDRVVEQLSGTGLTLHAHATRDGVRLTKSGKHETVIAASRALVDGQPEPILGNFLTAGEHWSELKRALRHKVLRMILVELPRRLSAHEVAQALDDSDQLRHVRTVEFGHAVTLQHPDASLRFEPIILNGSAVEVPFQYTAGPAFLMGALRLKTPTGPLALAIADRSQDEAVIGRGWVLALRGYAELTCVPVTEPPVRPDRAPRGSEASARRGGSAITKTAPRATPVAIGRGWTLSSALEPAISTRKLLATYVVGHRRRLPSGQQPSAEAREHVKRIGITLGSHETWVKPHARGVPKGVELVFTWRD